MSVRANAEILARVPLFSSCERAHLQVLAFSSQRREFVAGEILAEQGVRGSAALVLLEGRVAVEREERGRPMPVLEIGPGTLIGELAMVSDLPYAVTARASTSGAAALISHELFRRVAEEFPDFAAAIFTSLARKLEVTTAELARAKELFEAARSFRR